MKKKIVPIGGSSIASPPPFWSNSFWGITSVIQMAFPFKVISRGPYFAQELEVAAFHYPFNSGSLADFSINLDDKGRPGQAIGAFQIATITTTAQVLKAPNTKKTVLFSGQVYWLVGQAPQGQVNYQVNWNLADMVFGKVACRLYKGRWFILPDTNLSAFAILGTPIPFPRNLFLLGSRLLGLMGWGRFRKD